MARMNKHMKLLTEVRPDASGFVSVHPRDKSIAFLRRHTLDGWLALQIQGEHEPGFVPVDAIRCAPDGPWEVWPNLDNRPEFDVWDWAHVGGGPESAALALLGQLGQVRVTEYEDRVLLYTDSAAVSGPREEWRLGVVDLQFPEHVGAIMKLGLDELEFGNTAAFLKAGPLRAMVEIERAECPFREAIAGFCGEVAGISASAPEKIKNVVRKLALHSFDNVRYSAEIAPGWTFAWQDV